MSSGALCKHLVHAGEVLLETGRGGRGGRGERGGAYREHVQDSDSCPCCEVQARQNCRCLKVSGSLWPTAADTGVWNTTMWSEMTNTAFCLTLSWRVKPDPSPSFWLIFFMCFRSSEAGTEVSPQVISSTRAS